jgi:hypothetical protein
VTKGFESEIDYALAVVHGDATLPERPGHASGTYRSDVSGWLLAFSIGVEWDPHAVASTDKLNAGESAYKGRYFTAQTGATPMENWIASMLDHTAAGDAARGWSRPLTFTNWLTLDPLDHKRWEPLESEDLASVDATYIAATKAWPGGFFASYHAYPYYPDFMSLTPSYQTYERPSDGEIDPYAGYLHALRVHHGDQAVAITEFGVPSSLGTAHNGPLGRNQGDHSEQQAMAMNTRMLEDIKEEGYAAGILFEWVDEWFKFTWNTIDLELPSDRRQLWRNDLTNEEFFGVAASGKVIELRLPWALLGFSDPSSLTLYVEHPKAATSTNKAERVGIAFATEGSLLQTSGYAWEPWQRITWHEPRKAGFDDLSDTMRRLSATEPEK